MGGFCTASSEELPTYTETLTGTEMPAWVSAAGKQLYEQAASLAESPYPGYKGPRLATYGANNSKFTDQEQAGMNLLSGPQSGSYRNYFNQAYKATQGLGGGYTGMSSAELMGSPIDPGRYQGASSADLVGSYKGMSQGDLLGSYQGMSQGDLVGGPTDAGKFNLDDSAKEYLDIFQQAADPAVRELARQTSNERLSNAALASSKGAFGGSRAAIQDVTAAYEGAGRASDLRQQAAAQGLQFASGQFERDRGARLSASEADRAARFNAENLGRSGFESDRAARFSAENLGQSRFDADRGARFTAEGMRKSNFEADRAARLGVAASDREARFGAEEAMRGRYEINEASRLKRAQELKGYAPMLQGLQEQQASGMLAAGEAKRTMDQRALDLAYADYIEQREYPFAMTNFAIGALKGVPYDTKTYGLSQGNQYVQTPSIYGQTIAGLGSLYSAYRLGGGR